MLAAKGYVGKPAIRKNSGTYQCGKIPRRICTAPSLNRKSNWKVVPAAQKDGSDGGKRSEKNKADFSAYWSMKVRSWFSSRRQYLEKAERSSKDPENQERLDKAMQEQMDKLKDIEYMEQLDREQRAARDTILNEKAERKTAEAMKPLGKLLFPKGAPDIKFLDPVERANIDSARASEEMNSWRVKNVGLSLYRAGRLLRETLMLPFTLCAAGWHKWQALFKSQRYEMFLMAEGDRLWYWRNRTENERWFWEIFAWDRLLFPIICTVAYEYIVPNHIVWAVVVPCVFLVWQEGRVPGPFNFEFWLIAYFGLYQKCWPDVVAAFSALFLWA